MNFKKIIKGFTFIIIFFFTTNAFANVVAKLKNPLIEAKPGSKIYSIIEISIPSYGHIYANPKGQGIGKPISVIAHSNKFFKISNAKFLPGKYYISKIDNKPVYIFEKYTSVCLEISISKNIKTGLYKIPINIDMLFCSNTTCTPYNINLTQKIKIDNNAQYKPIDTSQYKQPYEIEKLLNKDYNAKNLTNSFKIIEQDSSKINLIKAILFGILAGFLLNFMPCVLPVISLKLLGFIKYSNQDKTKIKIFGLLFTLGVLTSFLFLAFLASFAGYNWGEIFQSETFLIIMIGIIFILSLSFFDVYVFNIPSFTSKIESSNQYIDSFLKGLIATILATPCSGPFLGATLTWALTQSPFIIFIIFLSIGTGMSLPYILVTLNPSLLKFIPNPGNWTIIFERIMGFFMLATVVYLLSILNHMQLIKTLWFLLVLSISLWIYGTFGNITKPLKTRIATLIITVSMVLLFGFFIYSKENTTKNKLTFENYKWENIVNNKDKQISIVVFTAKWCPNCKLVESITLEDDEVISFIRNNNIVIYKADITNKNPEAEFLMQKLNSHSIPFLTIFPKGKYFNQPVVLRDIYTKSDLLNALKTVINKSDNTQNNDIMLIPIK